MSNKPLRVTCSKIGSGATPRGGNSVYIDMGTTLIRSQNVYDDGFKDAGLVYIDESSAEDLSMVEIQNHDNLLNITGDSVARTCIVPSWLLPARVNQHVAIVRANPDILDYKYLHYWLISPSTKEHLLSLSSAGATRNALTKTMIEELQIPLPTLAEQKEIGQILGSLDDKIEANKITNGILEEIATTLFKSWFVEFDPVKAKAEGRKPFGMDEETSNLFPNSFEDSDLGYIPKGWKLGVLNDMIQVNPPVSINKETLIPWVQMSDLPVSTPRINSWTMRKIGSGCKFKKGDVLLARISPCMENGKLGIVDFLGPEEVGWGSTEFIVLRSREGYPSQYPYILARRTDFIGYASQHRSGTSGRQRVPASSVANYPMVIPPKDIALNFSKAIDPLFNAIKNNDKESKLLADIRNALLPKLLNGEIRIKDVVES